MWPAARPALLYRVARNDRFLDEFNAIAYSGSDGELNWTNDWQEIDDDGLVGAGSVTVVADGSEQYALRIQGQNNGAYREADSERLYECATHL